ncbi:hypothetical protein CHLRE_15g639300v5 [Chlamydomonas reinhardtii]|uniref:Uncharacterized protein n=1 Tax=Chlamydomonas reinhardtii TaxID=3055 RepID=A0A2K3CWQ7_CHLRE|nr:uncharacterized protein CHLRE_15g639300v5 [Chlamydomonas reinhardtii]PNW72716.1 hypothetical protein CHLRE_15g639300v5 [Chlamydomonas reinhardtii]
MLQVAQPRAARTAGCLGPSATAGGVARGLASATSGPAAAVLSGGGPLLAATAPAATGSGGGLRQLLPLTAWARQAAAAPATAAPAAAGARSCLLQPGRRAQQQVLAAAGRYGSGSTSDKSSGRSSGSSNNNDKGRGGHVEDRTGRGRAGGGRWAGGRTGGGGSRSGGGGGKARDPADDMSVCRTLEDLHDVIDRRLVVWSERQDVMTMSAAFNLCGKLDSARAGGPAATAAARAGIVAALAPALLPLVPRIRQPAGCSIPLLALAKAGAAIDGRVESQLAPALLQRLADPVLLKTATPQNLANALYALGKLWEEQQQRGSGWDPTSSPHLIALTGAVASRLRATEGHGFKPQHVSNSLWACAKLEYRNSDLLLPLAEAAAA